MTDQKIEGNIFHLKLATPFGIVQLDAESRMYTLDFDPSNIALEEQVTTIIMKSVSRSIFLSNLHSHENRSFDELRTLISKEVKRLPEKYQQKYDDLFSHENHKDIKEITDKIIETTTKKLKIVYNTKKAERHIGQHLKAEWLEKLLLWIMWVFGMGEEFEADYVEQLRAIVNEVKAGKGIRPDRQKDDLFAELTTGETKSREAYLLECLLISYTKDIDQILVGCKALWSEVIDNPVWKDKSKVEHFHNGPGEYSDFLKDVVKEVADKQSRLQRSEKDNLEKYLTFGGVEIVREMLTNFDSVWQEKVEIYQTSNMPWKQDLSIPDEIFKRHISERMFPCLSDDSRTAIETKIKMFKNIHAIRQIYGKQCYIGFIGPQNAGKSTLLNKLWNKHAETGMFEHTRQPTRYCVAPGVYAIDFPGSNSLNDQLSSALEQSGYMNNFQVYVIQFNGTPDKDLIAHIKTAYQLKHISGRSSKTLFCLNKAATLQTEKISKEYRRKFVERVKAHIEEAPYDEKEESLWKKLKDANKEAFGNQASYEEIVKRNEKMKQYILDEISYHDFIFTDWIQRVPDSGIRGPEEVRKRIQKFLKKSKILSSGETRKV